MKIAISGASGLIGSGLARRVQERGWEVVRLVRGQTGSGPGQVVWDPERGVPQPVALEGLDGVVHLAGASLAGGRWTRARRRLLRDSRIGGTRRLCEALAGLRQPPAVLVCASAVGYYGDRGNEWLEEESAPGSGFLAELVQEWEGAASQGGAGFGARVVLARLGVVLSPAGGALARQLPLFRCGLGGRLGHGRQFLSWISAPDVAAALQHALVAARLDGAVNVAAPEPVTNAEFTAALGRVLRRPACLPAPAWALRLALGGLADEALLASARVRPRRLLESGFCFGQPSLEQALRAVLAGAGAASPSD